VREVVGDERGVVAGDLALAETRELVAQERHQELRPLGPVAQRAVAQGSRMRGRDDDDAVDDARMQGGGRPAHETAVGVADQRRAGVPERADEPVGVAGQCPAVVAARRLVGVAVPAQVDRDRTVTGVGERGELMPPAPPELAEPVEQQH